MGIAVFGQMTFKTDLKCTLNMSGSIFRLDYYQRSSLTLRSKTYFYGSGIIGVAVGIFGLTKSIDGLNSLYFILLIGGISNILFAIIGKSLTKEKNFISISLDNIEFKNLFQKPKKILLDNILDIRIESKIIEFVLNDQQVKKYDFSIFSDRDIKRLVDEIEKTKSKLNE